MSRIPPQKSKGRGVQVLFGRMFEGLPIQDLERIQEAQNER